MITLVLCAGVWRYGFLQALDQTARRAEADLELASDRLTAQLQRYRELAVFLADHPDLRRLDTPGGPAAAQRLLEQAADRTGALDVMLAGPDGRVRVAARGAAGRELSGTGYFRRAMHGALGRGHGLKAPLDRRAVYFAAPIFAGGGVAGALVVAADVERLERAWNGAMPAVFFTDAAGRIFVANRSELHSWRRPASGAPGLIRPDGRRLPVTEWREGGLELWQADLGPYLPRRALHLVRPLPAIGMTGEILADIRPAQALAWLQAGAAAALCLAFGALLFLTTERRRALARANAALEQRVEARTRALSAANVALRREVSEREEAEAALRRAQADLVQAGKLSALGQMSAGLSHELNQPLMAIQSFAENGAEFLRRDKPETAARNLERISELARRMGRIIRNLRAFARQESEPAVRVDVVATLEQALELIGPRLAHEGIDLLWTPPPVPVWVCGGEVRLGQVFVNLLNNAADAMAGSARREIAVAVDVGSDAVTVEIADTGPGIAEPDRIFDPFYSTKEVGASEGMGLGLSISYGLVQSFGGAIRGRNREAGGAVFSVLLPPWDMEAAA